MADSRINVILGAKDQASKVVKGLRGQFEEFKRGAKAGFGLGAGIGVFSLASRGISEVVDFMGDAVSAASDLEEAQSKVNVVFDEGADVIHDWAETAARDMGLARREALEAAGTFGNFIQALGNTQEEASVMSRRLVELAADLASFNNTGVEETLIALRSGLAGEAEPMRRLGVSISAARVEANLLAKGVVRTKSEITDAMKVSERYAIVMQDTELAQGDFRRTSDGLANSQKILNAEFQTASEELGQVLLPLMRDLTRLMIEVVREAEKAEDIVVGVFGDERFQDRLVRLGDRIVVVSGSLEQVDHTADSAARSLETYHAAIQAVTGATEILAPATEALGESEEEAAARTKRLQSAMELLADQGLRDVAKEARQTGRALRKMLEGPDKERKAIKTLQQELRRAMRVRRQAAKRGREDAFGQADATVEQLREELRLARAGRRHNRQRLRAFRERRKAQRDEKKGVEETTDATDESSDAIAAQREEVRKTRRAIHSLYGLADDGAQVDIAVNDSEVDTALRKIRLFGTFGPITIPIRAPVTGGPPAPPGSRKPRREHSGGFVAGGQTAIIRQGEALFTPASATRVVPMDGRGGGSSVVVMDGERVGRLMDRRLGTRFAYTASAAATRRAD